MSVSTIFIYILFRLPSFQIIKVLHDTSREVKLAMKVDIVQSKLLVNRIELEKLKNTQSGTRHVVFLNRYKLSWCTKFIQARTFENITSRNAIRDILRNVGETC